jgi:hypothetical protein
MTPWKTMGDAPKDRAVLLWVRRFQTVPAGQSKPAPVVGFWNSGVGLWKVAPELLNPEEVLHPSHWMELPKPPGS